MKTNAFDVKSFSRFLELVGMSGDAEVKECILNFDENGAIYLQAITAFESVAVKGRYLTSGMETYEALGRLAIDNLGDLRKYLTSFGEDEKVKITKKENYLLLRGSKKTIKLQLRDVEYIPKIAEGRVDKLIKLGKKNVFILGKDNVERIIDDYNLLGSKDFGLKLEGGKLNYSATSWTKHKIEEDLKVESQVKAEVILTKYFIDVVTNIKDDIELGLNDNAPIYVGYKNKIMEIEWAIAPIVIEDEKLQKGEEQSEG